MTTPAETNPYAPPKTRVADVVDESHGLKKRSVLAMILFMFFSLGLYYIVWWFRRRPRLNNLNSPRKLPILPLLLVVASWIYSGVIGFIRGATDREPGTPEMLLQFFQLMLGITMIVYAFWAKEIIEDHSRPDPDSGPTFGSEVKLSGVMTFVFSIFYLQWAINRYIIAAQR